LALLGRHNIWNAMAAIATGFEAGIPLRECAAAAGRLRPPDKRGEVLHIGGATVINDCYNSNPEALKSMIATLASMPAKRRILVAGEMLELGREAVALHQQCGTAAAESGIDLVVGVRGNAEHLVQAAREAGALALFLPSPEEAGEWLKGELRKDDAVLLKASRGVGLERALRVLEA
jgi:UDP-N-acetylmuramoyl-tripeptide--D-alanyl-D-alanine ligase